MDFIIGLPKSRGYSAIYVVIDRLSKYNHYIPLRHEFSSTVVAEAFIVHVAKLHDIPKSIVSDRDKAFTSGFWQHLFKRMGTTLSMSSAYHPQTDGQSEALNKCLEQYHRCFTFNNPKSWVDLLPWAEFWYNMAIHTSAGLTPFKAVYGLKPPQLLPYFANERDPPAVSVLLQDRDCVLHQLKSNLLKGQARMKHLANKNRKDISFEIGDWVYVKLQSYKQHSLALRRSNILAMHYFSPFQVLQRLGLVAYKLKLPPQAKIHPVFHTTLLKQCHGDPSTFNIPASLLTNEQGPILQPAQLLQYRQVKRNSTWVPQVLVQWANLPDEDNSWEDIQPLQQYYPI